MDERGKPTAARGPYRTYTTEFVERAVRTAIEARHGDGPVQRSLRAVSVELGVPWASRYRWVRKAHPDRFGYYRPTSTVASDAPPFVADCAHGHNPDQRTVDAIRRDNERLARENVILKAVLSLVARDAAIPPLR